MAHPRVGLRSWVTIEVFSMTSIITVSSTELAQRRQKLRRQRRLKWLQVVWRISAVSGFAGALVWAATLPIWVIQREQVNIEGNEYIPEQRLRALLSMPDQASLLRIEPQSIAAELKKKAPIANATVERQLFPPGLTVQIRERHPVALAIQSPALATRNVGTNPLNHPTTGLLDESGVWIPLDSYKSLETNRDLPTLKILGKPDHYRPHWTTLYQAVSRSPVKILEIDWQDPANLILKTEMGLVHLGVYNSQFDQQLRTLDRMRQLPKKVNPSQIAYIDLKNPETPSIQMKQSHPKVGSEASEN